MNFQSSFWAIRCVWLRYLDVFRKNLWYGLLTTFAEPFLYLLSFGYGLGTIVGKIELPYATVTYRQFIMAGIVAQSVLFQGFFEGAYGGFIRMYYQRIFKAIATTPITLSEVLWGELLWDASKASFASTVVLGLGWAVGDFSATGALIAAPLCFLFSLLFAALGLWVCALSQTIEQISYPQYLIVFPMFLFCGVYFPVDKLPTIVQTLAWVFPLTSILSILRSLTLHFPFEPKAVPILLVWLLVLVFGSRRAMMKRLIH